MRQVFKEGEAILNKVAVIMASHKVSKAVERSLKGKTVTMLFEEAETPGALDRFYHLVTKDQERYSRDLKNSERRKGSSTLTMDCFLLSTPSFEECTYLQQSRIIQGDLNCIVMTDERLEQGKIRDFLG